MVVIVGVSCGSAGGEPAQTALPTTVLPVTTVVPTTVVPTTVVPTTTVAPTTVVPTTTVPPTTVVPTTLVAPPTTFGSPSYVGSIGEIDDSLAAAMTPSSFREGCPVPLGQLRVVEVSYWSYEDDVRLGRVIVHEDHAAGIAQVFEELFDARFPIASVDLVDTYDGSDQASMQANNTSAFNCREVAYRPGAWSNHAFGTAIDINPLVNPYVKGDFVDPEVGRPYVDRSADAPGMVTADDVVVQAFAKIGWSWGGNWTTAKDYQHFSANGR